MKRKQEKIIGKFIAYLLLSLGALAMIVPFIWMLSTSLKEPSQVFIYPPKWIPQALAFKNYLKTWTLVPFGRFFINSLLVAVWVTFGQLLTSSLAAYSFARLRFPGRDTLFIIFLGTMMVPFQVTMIPVYILMRELGWVDTYYALIIPNLFSAYGCFLLRQFFLTIPSELEDAAKIDGGSYLTIYSKIILPLAKPALATLGVFTFMASWNSFIWPLIVVNSIEMQTLPLGLASFQGLYTTDWTLLMAGTVIALIPVLIIFIFAQRFFIEGITLSGVKG